jgi:hypothetical protein
MRTNTGSEETLELISQAPLVNDEANKTFAAEKVIAAAEAQHAVAVVAASAVAAGDVVLAAAKARHATVP